MDIISLLLFLIILGGTAYFAYTLLNSAEDTGLELENTEVVRDNKIYQVATGTTPTGTTPTGTTPTGTTPTGTTPTGTTPTGTSNKSLTEKTMADFNLSFGDTVIIQSDSGKYLSTCNGCLPGGNNNAMVQEASATQPYTKWKLVKTTNTTGEACVSFQTLYDNKYLSTCNGCLPVHGNVAMVWELTNNDIWSKWTMEKIGSKISIKTLYDNKYLSRCAGCISGQNDNAMVAETANTSSWCQWSITKTA
jgi:hypothetical protein